MKKLLNLLSILIFSTISIFAQDFTGIHSSRYFPLQNISNQPADLVRDSAKWNINILSAQIDIINSIILQDDDFWGYLSRIGLSDLQHVLASEQSNVFVHGKLLLPSVSYKINKKHALSLWFDMRTDGIYRASSSDIINLFYGQNTPEKLTNLNDEYFKAVINSWMEYNLTYSGLIWENSNQNITGAVTLKYLKGGGSGYFNFDGIDISYDDERIEYFRLKMSFAVNESLEQAIKSNEFGLYQENGFGVDLGLSYSFIPDHLKTNKAIPYKLKIGFVINDIGSIKHHSKISQKQYDISMEDVPFSRFNGINSLEGLVDSIQKSVGFEEINGGSFSMDLPTKYTLMTDYNIKQNWFLHGVISYQPNLSTRYVDIVKPDIWRLKLTPRFENNSWGVYLPIGWDNRLGWQTGLGLRWKYLFLGSSTILSNLFIHEEGMNELYLGINIPVGKQ